ncbi:CCAAT/enhancer-binding protein gamma [Chrysoperla carnea]|uniref:CCAAT/enhancer-binding protein gamma n=1 Tax=Chrysoperla carnea TaxID=189513 RepID=UPI001D08142E|nr:CCAAT/enhancer-binding protein gamma [Chrysoperla carnea]
MAPRKNSKNNESNNNNRSGRKSANATDSVDSDDGTDEYRKKRDRNNQAVKRSRVKSKMRTQETLARVTHLKNENSILEEKVKTLTKELGFLKELFLAHAGSSKNINIEGVDLSKLLSDESTGTGLVDSAIVVKNESVPSNNE